MNGPFGAGSISLGLYIEPLDPPAALDEMLRQAELAAKVGFDGVTLSEHHGGFEGYLPSPLLGVSWILDRVDVAWSAACPILLPLRPVNLVVEEIAWLASRHPGRLGVGFAPGFAKSDFALAGATHETRRADYYRDLPVAVRALSGDAEGILADDPAVRRCAAHPVPVLAAAAGPIGAREAAKAKAGVLVATFKGAAQAHELADVYRAWGGSAARVVIRRCWLGGPPTTPERGQTPARPRSAPRAWPTGERTDMVTAATADDMIQRLCARYVDSDATALSIRLQLPGSRPDTTREQIKLFGTEVLPGLREAMGRLPRPAVAPTNGAAHDHLA